MKIRLKKRKKQNPNQIGFRLKVPIVPVVDLEEKIKEICQGIKGLLGVKIDMSGEKMIGITVVNSAGWEDKEFVKQIENKLTETIESKV